MSKLSSKASDAHPFDKQIEQLARALKHLQLEGRDLPSSQGHDQIVAQLEVAGRALAKVEEILEAGPKAFSAEKANVEKKEERKQDQGVEVKPVTAALNSQYILLAHDDNILFVNKALVQLLGYADAQQLTDTPLSAVIHPQFKSDFKHYLQLALQEQDTDNVAGKLLQKKGAALEVLLDMMAVPFHDKPMVLVTVHPPADNDKLQTATNLQHKSLEYLLKESPVILYTTAAVYPYEVTFISENIREIMGYTPQEHHENPMFWPQHIHPEDAAAVNSTLISLIRQGGGKLEYRFRFADGAYHWLYEHFKVITNQDDEAIKLVGCLIDITDKKESEEIAISLSRDTQVLNEELKASEEELLYNLNKTVELNERLKASETFNKLVISSVNEGVIVYDTEYKYRVWNTFMEKRFGLTASEVIGRRTDEVFPYVGKIGMISMLNRVLSGETVFVPDTYLPTSKTEGYWVTSNYSPLVNSQSEIIGVVSTVSDVTERKKVEQALLEQQSTLRAFYNSAQFTMCVYRLTEDDYIHVLPNQYMANYFGVKIEDILGKTATELGVSPKEKEFWLQTFRACLQKGETMEKEVLYPNLNRGYHWFLARFSPIDANSVSLIAIDITERKEAEEEKRQLLEKTQQLNQELEENRKQFKSAQIIAGIGSWEYDLLSKKGKWSGEKPELHGIGPSGELPDLQIFEQMLAPEFTETFRHALHNAITKGQWYDIIVKLQAPGMPHLWERSIGKPVTDESGKVVKLVGLTYDLTEQKNAEEKIEELLRLSQEMNKRLLSSEEELRQSLENTIKLNYKIRESEQRWQFALEGSGSGVWDWNMVTNDIFCSSKLIELLSHSQVESISSVSFWQSRIHPEDKDYVNTTLNNYLSGVTKNYQIEYRLLKSSGEIFWALVRGKVIEKNEHGQPLRMIGTMIDISEHKQYEASLANAAKYLDKIINTIIDPVFVKDQNYRLVLVNDAYCQFYQREREQLLGTTGYEFVAKETASMFRKILKNVLATGEDSISESTITKPDGEVHTIITKKSLYVNSSGQPFVVGTIVDITDQKQLQQRLKDKNDSLKKINTELDSFVYRTSHDLRSPLASVLGLINISRLEQEEKDRLMYLDLMEKSIRKLDSFIHDIINYAKNARVAVVRKKVDLKALIKEILEGLQFMEGYESIEQRVEIEQSVPFYSDIFRLKIIFNNLLSNAIKYRSTRVEQSYIHVKILVDEQRSVFEIKDNGRGIASESAARIFEMFYRASTTSTGSGIGLYIVKEAVNTLEGNIAVESALGQGTTFTVELPNKPPDKK